MRNLQVSAVRQRWLGWTETVPDGSIECVKSVGACPLHATKPGRRLPLPFAPVTPLRRVRESLLERAQIRHMQEGGSVTCPCCGSLTLPAGGQYELCPVCFWEDDGQDDHDA